jgi:hypothetical protein
LGVVRASCLLRVVCWVGVLWGGWCLVVVGVVCVLWLGGCWGLLVGVGGWVWVMWLVLWLSVLCLGIVGLLLVVLVRGCWMGWVCWLVEGLGLGLVVGWLRVWRVVLVVVWCSCSLVRVGSGRG